MSGLHNEKTLQNDLQQLFRNLAYKPGSVIDSHLSRRTVTDTLKPPPGTVGPTFVSLHGVAPNRVYRTARFDTAAGELLPRLSTLTASRKEGGGISLLHFSYSRLRRALPVILALRSPDFPHLVPFGSLARLSGQVTDYMILYFLWDVKRKVMGRYNGNIG